MTWRKLPKYQQVLDGHMTQMDYLNMVVERYYKARDYAMKNQEASTRNHKKRDNEMIEQKERLRIFLEHHGLRKDFARFLQSGILEPKEASE